MGSFYGFTCLRNSQAKLIVPLRSISFAVSSPGSSAHVSLPNEHKQTGVSSHSIPEPLLLGGQTDTWNEKRDGSRSAHRAFHLLPCSDAPVTPKRLPLFWLLLHLPSVPAFPFPHVQVDRSVRNSAGACAATGLSSHREWALAWAALQRRL